MTENDSTDKLVTINTSQKKIRGLRLLSIFLPCFFGWVVTYYTIHFLQQYDAVLFFMLPFVLGMTSTLIYSYQSPITRKKLRNNSYITLYIFCLGLLFLGIEGAICLAMAAPIGFPFTYIGFLFGIDISKSSTLTKHLPMTIFLLMLSVPSLMSFEYRYPLADELRSVTTSIDINASAETVWKNVVSFPQLKPPTEFVFRTGIAYPINATITGQGVGAVRHCNFSTGSFIEPITIWDKPNLLRFSVDDQPEPMKEMSIYDIHPNHLHGYWVSKQGQFKLSSLPNGHTLLTGTTWYVNKIKPDFYWTLWSDYIVHKIHLRVLEHIKTQSEL